jgi:glycolate oxidase iron-sulfur subunit
MRRLIDHWWPFIHSGTVEAIVVTASGCGAQLQDYGQLLRHDPHYAAKAVRVSALCRDAGDYLGAQAAALDDLLRHSAAPQPATRVAVHTPCTLQHAMQRRGDIERLLSAAGYTLTPVGESHLCCGSAGTYSLLQAPLAKTLRDRKLDALVNGPGPADASGRESRSPQVIVSANIGCLTHLQSGTDLPVRHWIELVADRLS